MWQWAVEQSLWMCKEGVLATGDAQTGALQQEPALHAWVCALGGLGACYKANPKDDCKEPQAPSSLSVCICGI